MDLRRSLDAWASRQHPALAQELPRLARRRLASLRERMHEQGTDPAWASRYAASCPVEGVDSRDYALRVVDLGADGAVLAGIHFYGLDVTRPFVGVVATERSPFDGEQVCRMHAALMEAFASFGVGISRWASGTHTAPFAEVDTAWVDQHVLGAPVRHLLMAPEPSGLDRVAVHAVGAGWYADYRAAWDAMIAAEPSRAGWLYPSEQAELEESEVFLEVRVDGVQAGWIAADRGEVGGIKGFEMMEQFLVAGARGKGLASAAQRRLCERLPDTSSWLLGTIDGQNLASRKTALRNGRWLLDSWWFVGSEGRASRLL